MLFFTKGVEKMKTSKNDRISVQILTGLMLGGQGPDVSFNKSKSCRFTIKKTLANTSYVNWMYKYLGKYCGTGVACKSVYYQPTKRWYKSCSFTTLTSPVFADLNSKWDFYSKIDSDVKLTHVSMVVWLFERGEIAKVNGNSLSLKLKAPLFLHDLKNLPDVCKVSSDGIKEYNNHNIEDIRQIALLKGKIDKKYGVDVKIIEERHYAYFQFSEADTRKFLKAIDGSIPAGTFQKKTGLWRNKEYSL
jgi:hypothetical protein